MLAIWRRNTSAQESGALGEGVSSLADNSVLAPNEGIEPSYVGHKEN